MDIHQMLDTCERLLELYGYAVSRNVGVVGSEVKTVDLALEPVALPTKISKPITHRIDLLGEKNDIERPFGRMVVMYHRGQGPVQSSDILNMAKIMEEVEAFYGMYLTNTGYTPSADDDAHGNRIEIITPEKLERLIGKATIEQPWWENYQAFKPEVSYKDSLAILRFYIENHFHLNWSLIWILIHEFAYLPYWKFTYYIAKKPGRKQKKMRELQGIFGINAHTGGVDLELHADPEHVALVAGKAKVLKMEAVNRHFTDFRAKLVKVHKPADLPKHVRFKVYKPSLEKHEAKLVAQRWLAKHFGVDVEDVIVLGRELVYIPFWRWLVFNRPYVKNIHQDTIWFVLENTAVYTNAFNYYRQYPTFRRSIISPHCERLWMKLVGGPDKYIKFMRNITFSIANFWTTFNLEIKSTYIRLAALLFQAGLLSFLYYYLRAPLPTLLYFFVVNLLLTPLHALTQILYEHTKRFPFAYSHPSIESKEYEAKMQEIEEQERLDAAEKHILEKEKLGKLTPQEQEILKQIRQKKAELHLKLLGV